MSNFLQKIQNLPEEKRKIILWSVVVVVGLGLFFFWFYSIKIRLKTFQKEKLFESIGVPQLKEELKEMPQIELSQINEEGLKQLEELRGEDEKQELEKQENKNGE